MHTYIHTYIQTNKHTYLHIVHIYLEFAGHGIWKQSWVTMKICCSSDVVTDSMGSRYKSRYQPWHPWTRPCSGSFFYYYDGSAAVFFFIMTLAAIVFLFFFFCVNSFSFSFCVSWLVASPAAQLNLFFPSGKDFHPQNLFWVFVFSPVATYVCVSMCVFVCPVLCTCACACVSLSLPRTVYMCMCMCVSLSAPYCMHVYASAPYCVHVHVHVYVCTCMCGSVPYCSHRWVRVCVGLCARASECLTILISAP